VRGTHARYKRFLAYGEADDLHGKIEEFRALMAKERDCEKAKQPLRSN